MICRQYYFVNGFLPNRMKLASSNSLKNEYSEGGAEKLDGDFSEKSDKLTNGIVEELGVSIA